MQRSLARDGSFGLHRSIGAGAAVPVLESPAWPHEPRPETIRAASRSMPEHRARILVVDEGENILRMFSRILGGDYEVTTESDGVRCLALIASRQFDVIVTDVRMPGADGLEVLRAAKSRARDTEVIVITACGHVKDAVEALKQGAYDYLQKPFGLDDALVVVEKALGRKRLRAQLEKLRLEAEVRSAEKRGEEQESLDRILRRYGIIGDDFEDE